MALSNTIKSMTTFYSHDEGQIRVVCVTRLHATTSRKIALWELLRGAETWETQMTCLKQCTMYINNIYTYLHEHTHIHILLHVEEVNLKNEEDESCNLA